MATELEIHPQGSTWVQNRSLRQSSAGQSSRRRTAGHTCVPAGLSTHSLEPLRKLTRCPFKSPNGFERKSSKEESLTIAFKARPRDQRCHSNWEAAHSNRTAMNASMQKRRFIMIRVAKQHQVRSLPVSAHLVAYPSPTQKWRFKTVSRYSGVTCGQSLRCTPNKCYISSAGLRAPRAHR